MTAITNILSRFEEWWSPTPQIQIFPHRELIAIEQDYASRDRDKWVGSDLQRGLTQLRVRCPSEYPVKARRRRIATTHGPVYVNDELRFTRQVLSRAARQQKDWKPPYSTLNFVPSSLKADEVKCRGDGSEATAYVTSNAYDYQRRVYGSAVDDYNEKIRIMSFLENHTPDHDDLYMVAVGELDSQAFAALAALKHRHSPAQVRAALKYAMNMAWYERTRELISDHHRASSLTCAKHGDAPMVISALLAAVVGDWLYIANMGRVRALTYKGSLPRRASVEHVLGEASEAKRQADVPTPLKDAGLTRALTIPHMNDAHGRAQVAAIPMSHLWGKTLVLVSSGISNVLSDSKIGSTLQGLGPEKLPANTAATAIVQAAVKRGQQDECGALVWHVPSKRFYQNSDKLLFGSPPARGRQRVGKL